GKALSEQSIWHERIAESRCMIDQARLLTLKAAHMMDVAGNKAAKAEIAMIKVVAPNVSCKVVDWAIQAHGAAGVSADFWLAEAYAHQRTVRIVDGPDEVHRDAILERIRPMEGVTDLSAVGLVIEVIVEDLDAKVAVLKHMEPQLPADAIVATNTSSLSVTALGGRLGRPERVVGMHFFNPATLLPLVEVVSGHATAPD